VTERKRTELERRRLASLVEQAADLMAISDLSGGTPIYLNEAGLKMVGFDSWQEARTRRGIHYMFPEDRPFVNEVLWPAVLEKGSWSGEMRFPAFKTGEPIPVLYSAFRIDDPETGQPVNVGNVCRDITERKRAEAKAREDDRRYREMQSELAHANRVATMGQLTASIAHEVNQPIAATVTHAHAALRWLGAGPPNLEEVRQALTSIVKDGNRAGEVVHRIRALVNKAPPRKDRLEINGAILEIVELTRGEAGKSGVSGRDAIGRRLARGRRRSCPGAAGAAELDRQRFRSHGRPRRGVQGIADQHGNGRTRRSAGRGAGFGAGVGRGDARAGVRVLLHDEADRVGAGPLDLPVDHRGPWRPPLGEHQPAAGRDVSLYAPGRREHLIVNQGLMRWGRTAPWRVLC